MTRGEKWQGEGGAREAGGVQRTEYREQWKSLGEGQYEGCKMLIGDN
jgi:hypothetical protein